MPYVALSEFLDFRPERLRALLFSDRWRRPGGRVATTSLGRRQHNDNNDDDDYNYNNNSNNNMLLPSEHCFGSTEKKKKYKKKSAVGNSPRQFLRPARKMRPKLNWKTECTVHAGLFFTMRYSDANVFFFFFNNNFTRIIIIRVVYRVRNIRIDVVNGIIIFITRE